jgi:3-methyl-2-oxobutanoate hydroxymethyltransferase
MSAPSADALRARKGQSKLVCITAYDVAFARLCDRSGVDLILVGDSLGMVVQGHANTLPVTMDDMVYHTRAVRRGTERAHLCADLPFMSYQASQDEAVANAGRLIKDGGAESVKLEGGVEMAETVRRLVSIGIPVMGHVGMTPQSVHRLGGFKVQGRQADAAQHILEGAQAIAEAGAYSIVLEGIPTSLGAEITRSVPVPTIGIGAGADCDGQILVLNDLLGLDPDWKPKFARRFATLGNDAMGALAQYASEVRDGRFPSPEESFK